MQETDQRNEECTPQSTIELNQARLQELRALPARGPGEYRDAASGDTSFVRGRLTSRRFVGRQSQLAELELAYREALESHPRLILSRGDSGVGKTRLLAEAEPRCSSRPLVLHGQCLEQGELELPYAPLLGALRPLVRDGTRCWPSSAPAQPCAPGEPAAKPRLAPPRRRPAAGADGQCGCSRACWSCCTCSASVNRWCSCSRTCTGRTARRARSPVSSPAA